MMKTGKEGVVRFDLAGEDGQKNDHHRDVPAEVTFVAPRSTMLHSTALRGNLTRQQRNRDPFFYYKVVSVLGVGSMGSVAKVRKRESVVGGSARKDLQDHFRKEKQLNDCFHLPLIGGLFKFCLKGLLEYKEPAVSVIKRDPLNRRSSSLLQTRTNLVEDYNDGDATRSNDGLTYAMKSIHLSRVTDENFIEELKNEIKVLKTLDHPHIVKAIETFEHKNQIFIVMEQCCGGDLYARDPYTEDEAARITSSILSAISYMHSRNICHRDLKYENILFVNTKPQSEIKLIDFGLSSTFGKEELTDGVGTM
jgi:serine/threonine protein kinase